jgi:hypothetical protein
MDVNITHKMWEICLSVYWFKIKPAFNFTKPPSSPLKPNTWIASLGRPLRLSSIPTIWTERLVFVSASHGSLSSAPSRNLLNMTPDLQGYKATKVNARSPFLAPKLLGQCSLSSPGFFPTPDRSSAAYRPPSATCWYDLHHRPYPSPICWFSLWPTLPLSLFLYSWLFLTGGSVCSHLLTLVPRSRILLPWRWRRYVPPKRLLTQDLHSATSQKTTFLKKIWFDFFN